MESRLRDVIVERYRRRVREGRGGESAKEEDNEGVRQTEVTEEVVVLGRVRAVNGRVVEEGFN